MSKESYLNSTSSEPSPIFITSFIVLKNPVPDIFIWLKVNKSVKTELPPFLLSVIWIEAVKGDETSFSFASR